MKQYIGISRDHSCSMYTITEAARKDYNANIESIKNVAIKNNIDTIVSVVKCGVGSYGKVEREIINSNVTTLRPLGTYFVDGGSTPLFDSVNDLIQQLSSVPDANDPNVSFLVMVITDGAENSSKISGTALGQKIQQLQNTDKWTFIFRVPRGYTRTLTKFGIPEGNILEWDQTNRGMEVSTQATTQAFENFYTNRSKGIKSTKGFYSDLSNVSIKEIEGTMNEITDKAEFYYVGQTEAVAPFCLRNTGKKMEKGAAFYELTKHEKEIQEYKKICIQNKKTRKVYEGIGARTLLGLPKYGSISLSPGDHGDYKIYIQSTSLNRKLVPGTYLLYWEN